ncbi:MAG: zinc ribbon domain-containing protein [Pseudomonadota bacterium]|nr:MAG: zinc ribbon domain-containing protein [Pseudomonadota bacterium]
MPFYEYRCRSPKGCPHCHESFTVLQRLDDEPLSKCPRCGAAVRRLISPPSVVGRHSGAPDQSTIEKAGFTQYRRIGRGVYEKSAGKGPDIISDD